MTMEITGQWREDAAEDESRLTAALVEITERRATIEQAKGMLMLLCGVDADEAFGILRHSSQQHNVKLRRVAEQICEDVVRLSRRRSPVRFFDRDRLLATVLGRIGQGEPG